MRPINMKLILPLLLIALILASGCSSEKKLEGSDCRRHSECGSGVCDHYKADMGYCSRTSCIEGEKTDNQNFFCNSSGEWEASKQEGESCVNDFECYEPTCFMVPQCDITAIPQTTALCRDNACIRTVELNECEEIGMKKILREDYCGSLAQMILPTVCAPCGDGVCDTGLETSCNCYEDCEFIAGGVLTDGDIRAELRRLQKINTYPDNVQINPGDYPKAIGTYSENGLTLVEEYFCSDVCPDYGGVLLVFEDVPRGDCEGIGGVVKIDPAWRGYIGCAPNVALNN